MRIHKLNKKCNCLQNIILLSNKLKINFNQLYRYLFDRPEYFGEIFKFDLIESIDTIEIIELYLKETTKTFDWSLILRHLDNIDQTTFRKIILFIKKISIFRQIDNELIFKFGEKAKNYIKNSWGNSTSNEIDFITAYLDALHDSLEYIVTDYPFFRELFCNYSLFYSDICFPTILSSENAGFVQRCVSILKRIVDNSESSFSKISNTEVMNSVLDYVKETVYSKHGQVFSTELSSITVKCIKSLIRQHKTKTIDWISRVLFGSFICQKFVVDFWAMFLDDASLREIFLTTELQIKLISFWVDTICEYQSDFYHQLSMALTKIPLFSSIIDIKCDQSTDNLIILFIKNLKKCDDELSNEERPNFHKRVNTYFSNFSKNLHSQINASKNNSSTLYEICSKLVATIPYIIYKKVELKYKFSLRRSSVLEPTFLESPHHQLVNYYIFLNEAKNIWSNTVIHAQDNVIYLKEPTELFLNLYAHRNP
ncbi:hypothetical protein HZS_1665, partial [Henneguya salminicola]